MTKLRKLFLPFLVLAGVGFVVLRWYVQQSSPVPERLGVQNGRLAACPQSPNCVSTEAVTEQHAIPPIPYTGSRAAAQQAVLTLLNQTPRTIIVSVETGYIHAEVSSLTWGFVDDVEFFFDDDNKLIQMRSASRLGYGDMGVNRSRLEALRAQLDLGN